VADIVKTTNSLKLLAAFSDEDDRTITVNNGRSNVTAAEVFTLATLALPVLIGDKYGAAFTRFKSATYVSKTETTLDPTTLQPT